MYDKDCSGTIERKEFNNLCCDLGQDFDEEELDEAFSALDEDESGKISFEEFMKWWLGD
jgi:Ca2+-binding EF-hand superfamily protein